MSEEINTATLEAVRAMYAWFWAEENPKEASMEARVELCNYAQHLSAKALSLVSGEYVGVPRCYLHGIERADEDNCKRLIEECFAAIAQKQAA